MREVRRRASQKPKLRGEDGASWVAKPAGTTRFDVSPFGVLDMGGNVLEHTSDWYSTYDDGPARDPRGPPSGVTKVVRGDPDGGPLWRRLTVSPWRRSDRVGFRCAYAVAAGAE